MHEIIHVAHPSRDPLLLLTLPTLPAVMAIHRDPDCLAVIVDFGIFFGPPALRPLITSFRLSYPDSNCPCVCPRH
jgi:hypothetical protein